MPSEAGIADCRVSECDRKTVPCCGNHNRKCLTAVCGQSVTWDHKCVLLSRPEMLPWHDSADWDDMVQQIVWCEYSHCAQNYPTIAYCDIETLKLRRHNFRMKFFKQICHPESCLHNLLTPDRNPSLFARLWNSTVYPIRHVRIKCYCSFMNFAL